MRRGVQGPLARSTNSPVPVLDYRPPPDDGLSLCYVDKHILVLDKPAGLLSVPGKGEALSDCMEARVQARFPSATTVHRLDRATSGLFLMARTPQAHRHLGLQFEKRRIEKTYLAMVDGHIEAETGEIDQPLRTDWYNRPKQMVDPCLGRPALTRWQVIGRDAGTTRLALFPQTGRTHQLRVHLQALGHPILGDEFYAGKAAMAAADRLLLHAWKLAFRHPATGDTVRFEAPCPF